MTTTRMVRRRRILYLTGTRADFGLMRSTLRRISSDERLDLALAVTGMHLLPAYGLTANEIRDEGWNVVANIPVALDGASTKLMAQGIATILSAMSDVLDSDRPDALLLLGDRGEMLAGAIAALHLGIPSVHIHGGELSGSVDEPIRHAISKLAIYHFTADREARDRLIRMGERPDSVFVTGAPGLVGIRELANLTRESLCKAENLDPAKPIVLLVFHSVVQEAEMGARQVTEILDALDELAVQIVALVPNADAGGAAIHGVLAERLAQRNSAKLYTHLPRNVFLSWVAATDVMVGNSSSGIIEAASFATPVVNVGQRQNLRKKGENVIDVPPEHAAVRAAVENALSWPMRGRVDLVLNPYGDGRADARIAELLATLPLGLKVLSKVNAY